MDTLNCDYTNIPFIDLTNNNSINTFFSFGCKYVIPSDATDFDPYRVPDFDAAKVSDVTNADFNSSTGMFTNIIGDVTYTYVCGQGYSETFTLTRTG